MSLAYRLIKKKWLDTAFDGTGPKRYGGRWNSKGRACVYASGSESLAMLEVMVHLKDYKVLPEYTILQIEVPRPSILTLSIDELPKNWQEFPAPPETAEIGDSWLEEGASLALAVPSVVSPRENNYILNPAHDDFVSIVKSAKSIEFKPDPRL